MLHKTSKTIKGTRPTGPFSVNRDSPHFNGLVSWVPLTQWDRGFVDFGKAGSMGPLPTNAPTMQPIEGSHGTAMKFVAASDQYVTLGNPVGLQITSAITISCWYRLASVPSNGSAYRLVTKDKDTGGRAYGMDVFRSDASAPDSGVRFYINGGAGAGVFNNISREGIAPAANDLKHAVGIFNPQSGGLACQVYVNGAANPSLFSATADASIPTATANVLIGRAEYSGFTNPFDGNIWDVRIYNRALFPDEVYTLYDPETRWDLYWVPPKRVYFDVSAAVAALRRLPLLGAG